MKLQQILYSTIVKQPTKENHCLWENLFKNGAGGVNNGTNQQRTILEETRVKTIECLDEFDEGSENDDSTKLDKKGVILKNIPFYS